MLVRTKIDSTTTLSDAFWLSFYFEMSTTASSRLADVDLAPPGERADLLGARSDDSCCCFRRDFAVIATAHGAAALFQLLHSFVFFVLADPNLTVPVMQVITDVWSTPGSVVLTTNELFKLQIEYVLASFLLLDGLEHLVAWVAWSEYYEKRTRQGRAYFRWIQYAIAAPMMNVAIAAVTGVVDLNLHVSVFALTSITMFFGYQVEEDLALEPNAKVYALKKWLCGWIPFAAAWFVLLFAFHSTAAAGKSSPPLFVYFLVWVLFAAESSFAVVALYFIYALPRRPEDRRTSIDAYVRERERVVFVTELAYIICSVAAKSLLTWIEYGGTRALSNNPLSP